MPAGAIDGPSVEFSIGFGPQVGKEMMAAAPLPLGTERRQVDRPDDDLLAGPGVGLGQDPAVEVDDHAAARPRERRIIRRLAPWLAATTNAKFSTARARLNSVHQSMGGVAPQGSM